MIRILLSAQLGKRGWTQADLARKTRIRPSTISELCRGSAKLLNIEHLDLICEAFNCRPEELIQWEPNDEPRVLTRAGVPIPGKKYLRKSWAR